MEFRLLPILAFFSLLLVEAHGSLRSELNWPLQTLTEGDADLPSKVYWNLVLPNTPMPKVVLDSLRPGNAKVDGSGTRLVLKPRSLLLEYFYAMDHDQLRAYQNYVIFFFEKDLHTGKKMRLKFEKSSNAAAFLPLQVANSVPFSSNELPKILNRFSVETESAEAKVIKDTIELCEGPVITGEQKYCTASLESMVDFSTSNLGNGVKAISTEVEKEIEMQYTVAVGVERIGGDHSIACHKLEYPYALFYCHQLPGVTRAYMVPLVGDDGSKANAVAVCHTDTSNWNPRNPALQLLNVKPGTSPICHFLPEDHIIWFLE